MLGTDRESHLLSIGPLEYNAQLIRLEAYPCTVHSKRERAKHFPTMYMLEGLC